MTPVVVGINDLDWERGYSKAENEAGDKGISLDNVANHSVGTTPVRSSVDATGLSTPSDTPPVNGSANNSGQKSPEGITLLTTSSISSSEAVTSTVFLSTVTSITTAVAQSTANSPGCSITFKATSFLSDSIDEAQKGVGETISTKGTISPPTLKDTSISSKAMPFSPLSPTYLGEQPLGFEVKQTPYAIPKQKELDIKTPPLLPPPLLPFTPLSPSTNLPPPPPTGPSSSSPSPSPSINSLLPAVATPLPQVPPPPPKRTETKPHATASIKKDPFIDPTPPQVVELSHPYDLLSLSDADLMELCRTNHISPISSSNFQLIGRLLSMFPWGTITYEELHRFKEEELKQISSGLYISDQGDKERLIRRLLNYVQKEKSMPITPAQAGPKPSYTRMPRSFSSKKTQPKASIKSPSPPPLPSPLPPPPPVTGLKRKNPEDDEHQLETPQRKRRRIFAEKNTFLEIAPVIPVEVAGIVGQAFPQALTDTGKVGWVGKGKQMIHVGSELLRVKWNLVCDVLNEEDDSEDE